MNRRLLLKMGAACLGTAAAARPASAFVPAHNWDGYNWGTAPPVKDRLYQGPFPQYPPEQVLPGSEVVMATTPLARGRARLRHGSRHLRHGRLRGQHLPGRGHGEGDRGLRAAAVGPETLRPAHVARAAEAPGPPGSRSRTGGRPSRWRSSTASASASASR